MLESHCRTNRESRNALELSIELLYFPLERFHTLREIGGSAKLG